MTTHAKLSPSSAHRWMKCAGSMILENGLPNTSSAHADEGTAAHFLGSECLEQGKNATDFLNQHISIQSNGNAMWEPTPDLITSRIYKVDLEMSENVQKYIDAIRSQAEGNELLIEQRLDFSEFVGVENAFGTADAIVLTEDEIQVHDLKYGRVKVDAEENEQLKLYALGALSVFGMFGDFKKVRMAIHQPRIGHVSEAVVSIEELYTFGEVARSQVQHITSLQDGLDIGDGASIEEFKASLVPGEKQCYWCKAKATCPALTKQVLTTITGEFDDLTTIDIGACIGAAVDQVASQENELLGKLFASTALIESWLKAVAIKVSEKLHLGEKVPGYKLVQGRGGSRKWLDDEEAEQLLKSMRLKVEQMYDLKLISPTAAEKLQKADAIGPRQWTKVENLITRSDGKPTVAPESDKRPALDVNPSNDFEIV